MKIRKAFKFRLKPDEEQLIQLNKIAGHCRFLWNKVLSVNLERLENKQHLIWYHEADFFSKLWKSSDEYAFLKEIPAHCLQQKLKDLDKAFRDAFNKNQPLKRMPRFKKKGLGEGFRFPEPKHIKVDNKRVRLPKLGWIGFYKSRKIEGSIKNATVSQNAGRWYISIQTEIEANQPVHPTTNSVGIDLGITKTITMSNGETLNGPKAFKLHLAKLAKAQRMLAKKKKFSKNWRKQKKEIQKIHSKIANIRRDFLHKSSTKISKNHAMIVVEDLKISNMSKSAKGTIDEPGKCVSAKLGLNKAILDEGWGEFKRQLEYKQSWLGGVFLEVNPQYTSQKCCACGFTHKGNRQTQERFKCMRCELVCNADLNAAKNILAAGHAVLVCGEIGLPASLKQEPLECGNAIPA